MAGSGSLIRGLIRAALALLAMLALAGAVHAQAPTPPAATVTASDSLAAQSTIVDQAQSDLHTIFTQFRGKQVSDDDLKSRQALIPSLRVRLQGVVDTLTPRLADIDARLAQLGPPPAVGQPPEGPENATTRRNLTRYRALVDGEIKQALLVDVEADQAAKALADQLRANFSERLWTQSRSILDPTLWRDFVGALPADLTRLQRAAGSENGVLGGVTQSPIQIGYWVLAAVLALAILGPIRVWFNRFGYRRATAGLESPNNVRRSALAFWRVLVSTLAPLSAAVVLRAALAPSLSAEFLDGADLTIRVIAFMALLRGLGKAVLSPRAPQWRLAPLSNSVASRLAPFPSLIGIAAGVATLAAGLNSIFAASLPTSIAVDCLTVVAEIAVVGGALAMVGRARNERLTSEEAGAQQTRGRVFWVLAALAAWLALAAAALAVLTGFLALASFLMHETIWVGAVLAATFLLLRLADDLFPSLLAPGTRLGSGIKNAIGLSDSAVEQIGVLLSGLSRLAILLIGWTTVLAPFGASANDIVGRVTATNWVLRVGQVVISPGTIIGAIALFLVGLVFTRAVRGWLEIRYLPKTGMDVGVRTSLAAAVSYGGVVLAILFTFAYLGLSLNQIALFASALSVGIGFGLQAIISNFVSGLILLIERPIKVGDWIAIGDLEGDVKAINIRATEIEMMDRSKLIVPNSDLISKTVRNVTHGANAARLRIMLRTEASIDPTAMRDLMLGRLQAHPEVREPPVPTVFLSDVRDGALEFTAFAYVASARSAYRVRSELLFQIVPDMKAKGISLASLTPVVNIGLPDRLIEPEAGPTS